jgi:hypothetical protein
LKIKRAGGYRKRATLCWCRGCGLPFVTRTANRKSRNKKAGRQRGTATRKEHRSIPPAVVQLYPPYPAGQPATTCPWDSKGVRTIYYPTRYKGTGAESNELHFEGRLNGYLIDEPDLGNGPTFRHHPITAEPAKGRKAPASRCPQTKRPKVQGEAKCLAAQGKRSAPPIRTRRKRDRIWPRARARGARAKQNGSAGGATLRSAS